MNTHLRSLQRVLNHVDTARVERWAGQLCDTFEGEHPRRPGTPGRR